MILLPQKGIPIFRNLIPKLHQKKPRKRYLHYRLKNEQTFNSNFEISPSYVNPYGSALTTVTEKNKTGEGERGKK